MATFAIAADGLAAVQRLMVRSANDPSNADKAFVSINDWARALSRLWLNGTNDPSNVEKTIGLNLWTIGRGYSVATISWVYKMRGEDAIVEALYDAWLADGSPDLTGSKYKGSLAQPLRNIVVIDRWEV